MEPRPDERHSDAVHRQEDEQRDKRKFLQKSSHIAQPVSMVPCSQSSGICSRCKGAGYTRQDVPYGHPAFGKPEKCVCKLAEEREKRQEKLRHLSAMEHLAAKTFETFNRLVPGVQMGYRLAQQYACHPDGWLLFIGSHGCGKTHVAAAIGNRLLHEGRSVLFVTVPDLLDHLRMAYAPTSPVTYDEQFMLTREVEMLILDDLGAQQATPWAEEKLFQLINYRYTRRSLTVITTNHIRLSGINERIRSRLQDAGLVQEITFEHVPDYRRNTIRKKETSS